ncbi:hypothetical protein ACH5RR_038792 [Cinchona calisaya]|uniref:Protein kinase domain-containing protein n=1 Tax=Cinchona calisaya TaxID=153742 RepID=A0ABD2Y1W6_9GENT
MSKYKLSLVSVLLFLGTSCCIAKKSNHHCPPSSCGDIPNISYPFRLKGDPDNCGDPNYELDCNSNRTLSLSLNSKIYHVLEIDYAKYRIRVVDPGLDKANCSSFPTTVLEYDDIPKAYIDPDYGGAPGEYLLCRQNSPVAFVHCTAPAKSALYIDIKSCRNHSSSIIPSNSQQVKVRRQNYSYVLVGDGITIADLEESCTISMFAWVYSEEFRKISNSTSLVHWTPYDFRITNSTAFLDIFNVLSYGFVLPFYRVYCNKQCEKSGGYCYLDYSINNTSYVTCVDYCDREPSRFRLTLKCLRQVIAGHVSSFLGTYDIPRYIQIGILIGLYLAGRFSFGTVCLLALVIYYKVKRWHLSMYQNIEDFLQGPNNLMPVRYTYSNLKKMTNNFSNKLGEGGYGTVFKGKLRSGPLVAVKLLGKSKANGQEFISEVATIGRIHHANVVKLIGFCFEGSKRALVYEFMPNGSLDKYIFPKETEPMSLSCEELFKIALEVARGIDYLHRGCEMQILHFDIKPHNILLDEHFSPKISDFGLAKLCPTENNTVTMTAARGTLGYMAPELYYKNIGGVSYKADVYSFGMLLMEMAGRRKNLNPFVDKTSQIYFPSWVYDQMRGGNEIEMGDVSEDERKMVKKMILVALWCIQMKPTVRPSMNKVIEMLEGDGELLEMPPKPFQSPDEMLAEDDGIDPNTVEFPLLSEDQIDSSDISID